MKKYFPILAICLAVLVGATVYASSLKSEKSLAAQKVLLKDKKSRTAAPRQKVGKANVSSKATGTPYWCEAISYYDTEGEFTLYEGETRAFGVRIDIDGENATIYGLIDLYFDEVDAEYPVKGKYDSRRNTITIDGTQYDSEKNPDEFLKIADMYSEKNGEYSLVLFAGDFNDWGEVETVSNLVLNVSEDGKTITSTTSYGAYAFDPQGDGMGFYDYYRKSTITKADEGISVSTSTNEVNFNGLFTCPKTTVEDTFMILNKGMNAAEFSISTDTPEIVCVPSSGTIEGCSSCVVKVRFTPEHAGNYENIIHVTVDGMETPLDVKVSKEVVERPDYMKIVQSGNEYISFEMSPIYPFVESEYDGHLAFMSTNEGEGNNTESYFICNIDVPEGKTAIFSWKAVQMASSPNCLIVMLDGENYMYDWYVSNDEPYDMSGNVILYEGHHEVAFDNYIMLDWSIYDSKCRSYVWDLNLIMADSKPDNAYCPEANHTFAPVFFDRMAVISQEDVTIFNMGSNPLKVLDVVGEGNFSGIVPDISVPLGGQIQVPIVWTASAIGTDKGTVTIKTTGGDFAIECEATAQPLPADYSLIVKEGEFSFNTSAKYPFILNANKTYAYNSTSKVDVNETSMSWIEASFEVEEGEIAILDWDAINDSEAPAQFMGETYLRSGTIITIDGANERMVGGVAVDCAATDCYNESDLTFGAGIHNVRFTYKKMFNTEEDVFGDDRLKLFELSLRTMNAEDHKGSLSEEEVTFPKILYCGCIGHMPLTLYNYTGLIPELTSVECDGPFTVGVKSADKSRLLMNVEFNAEKAGSYEAPLTIHTNIGDYTVFCKGISEESTIGYALFYEGFEYDFLNDWIIEDTNKDEMTWEPVSAKADVYEKYNPLTYDGSESLFITCYDMATYEYADNFDDIAATPLIEIPSEGKTTLRFMERNYCFDIQTLEILVGDGDDFASYEVVEKFTFNDVIDDWNAYEVDLSAYAGKKVRVAFRAGELGGSVMAIDDVLIANDALSAVSSIPTGREIVAREYYSTDGKRLATPSEAIYIEVTHYNDGTVKRAKVVGNR